MTLRAGGALALGFAVLGIPVNLTVFARVPRFGWTGPGWTSRALLLPCEQMLWPDEPQTGWGATSAGQESYREMRAGAEPQHDQLAE